MHEHKGPDTRSKLEEYLDRLSSGDIGLCTGGDSWFDFPAPNRKNIVEHLIRRWAGKAVFYRMEKCGQEARQEFSGKNWEKWQRVLSHPKARFHAVLISMGGNDAVGPCLLPLLREKKPGMQWADCIDGARLQSRLDQIEGAFNELADLRDDYQPEAIIFSHDYDVLIPSDKPVRLGPFEVAGPWILPHLLARGITVLEDQKNVVGHIVLSLGQRIRRWAAKRARCVHVPTQGTLSPQHWIGADEIHPNGEGFGLLADKFAAAVSAVFPVLKGQIT